MVRVTLYGLAELPSENRKKMMLTVHLWDKKEKKIVILFFWSQGFSYWNKWNWFYANYASFSWAGGCKVISCFFPLIKGKVSLKASSEVGDTIL